MELVLASNFDDRLVRGTADLPVTTFFGNYPVSLTGGGRPPQILPAVSEARFRTHLEAVHRAGRDFYATLNSADLGLREYAPEFGPRFLREVDHLLELGVDGFVVALPLLVELLRREHPSVPVSVSTFARVRSVTQAEYFLDLGADTIVLEEANRDFGLVRGLAERGARVEILVNQTCIKDCPYRFHHLSTTSLASQPGRAAPAFELPILECGLELLRDPARLLSSVFVRPEDLETYEEAGVHRFKISGRNRSTDWLLRAARAYAARSYPGNLLDLMSFVQVRGPRQLLHARAREPDAAPELGQLAAAFDRVAEIAIDNSAIPRGFLKRISLTDCAHLACRDCGWCPSVAERAMRIGGRPLSEYAPPAGLPGASRVLSSIRTLAPRGAPPA